jgi:hypothetical protein
MKESGWSVLATYSSGLEADIAMAQLETAQIPALRDNNNAVGIFGPGFQGTTPQGFTIRVPTGALDDARAAVNLDEGRP